MANSDLTDVANFLAREEVRRKEIAERAEREAAELSSLPTIDQLCLTQPLYTRLQTSNRIYLKNIRDVYPQFDAYCVGCKREATFKDMRSRGTGSGSERSVDWMLEPGRFSVSVMCTRASHWYTFNFCYDGEALFKYGQLPSLEDIAGHDIKKYAPLLREGYFEELKRATGLASHGIGIGSFVYLRRIFEKLIVDHHEVLINKGQAVDGFVGMRMDEKIGALRDELPSALVKNKATYAILSSGIHALDEDTCRRYFPVVRAAIIEILEQDLRAREEAKAGAELEAQIARLAAEVKARKEV